MTTRYPALDGRQACADVDPEVFFPGPGPGTADQAVAVCLGCVFRDECRDYALDRTVHGVWGATTAGQRLVIRSRRVPA